MSNTEDYVVYSNPESGKGRSDCLPDKAQRQRICIDSIFHRKKHGK